MKRAKRNNIIMSATLAASLFLTACSSDQNEDTVVEKDIVRPVKLITIESTDAINIRRFPAELKASEEADLAFRVGGQLMQLNVVSGQRVKKGERLASLDTTDFKLQVELAQANQYLAEAQFKRIQTIFKQNATTKSEYDSAKASLDQANNALQSSKNQLNYTQVFAPFDGVIASVSTENFQYVSATQTLMHIQNIDQLDVEFQVPESLVVSIKSTHADYMANVVVDVAPKEKLYGTYKEHNTTPDDTTMAYNVTLNLIKKPSVEQTLLPGMTANVDIDLSTILGKEKHITVPVEAVLRHEDTSTGQSNSSVWVFNKDTQKVESRTVTLGALLDDQVEITSGLSAGEQIVAAGVYSLTDSMHVRPWTRERGL
ncbi:efflux RND transporter periplasmic adaptor subunit [Marinomonas sp. M1K-6]|uniref:Efflux RND transporter periplasmic adaptor subunit n=1 Tax=Marinomonas profundi TaxID=2726122 RepID=A0A847QZI0_9GAMM|nr:efflux RND transporter periplasmic adaptor subunit [Marinomonas profundi]NLQ18749.1 efflux RND transporter periplasmic adaptor subunit [Marinomonas profundi]UDV04005.1 efflux RND transporter periplasmic adaptor subunit [Marinomonas profundi]